MARIRWCRSLSRAACISLTPITPPPRLSVCASASLVCSTLFLLSLELFHLVPGPIRAAASLNSRSPNGRSRRAGKLVHNEMESYSRPTVLALSFSLSRNCQRTDPRGYRSACSLFLSQGKIDIGISHTRLELLLEPLAILVVVPFIHLGYERRAHLPPQA